MQPTTFAVFAFSTFVYISSTITAVYGYRCRGQWRVHACYGGQGKRSGPPPSSSLATDSDLSDRQLLLRQLLLPSSLSPRFSNTNDLSPQFPVDNDILGSSDGATVDSDIDSMYPDDNAEDTSVSRARDIEKVRTILGEMLFQRRDRKPTYDSRDMLFRR